MFSGRISLVPVFGICPPWTQLPGAVSQDSDALGEVGSEDEGSTEPCYIGH